MTRAGNVGMIVGVDRINYFVGINVVWGIGFVGVGGGLVCFFDTITVKAAICTDRAACNGCVGSDGDNLLLTGVRTLASRARV